MGQRDINIENIMYNQLSQAKYQELLETGKLNPNEFYITPHEDTYDWSHMTNCMTKIPRNIKVEINGGSLVLKKGSIVTFPNGFNADGTERFDYVTLEQDVIATPTTAWAVGNHTACLVKNMSNGNYGLLCRYTTNMTSTPATPVAYDTFYNTTTNQILGYDTNASSPNWGGHGEISLPLCTFNIVSLNGTDRQVSTIFQTFQSAGYIGSILWTDKGVSCLIPNGRNDDGSLRNIDYTTSRCKIHNVSGYGTQTCFFTFGDRLVPLERAHVNIADVISDLRVPTPAPYAHWYDRINNFVYDAYAEGTSWNYTPKAILYGTYFGIKDGVITGARFPEVQEQADYCMTMHQLYEAAPTGTVIAMAGSSLPAGYLLCNGAAYRRDLYSRLYNVIGTKYGAGDGSTTFLVPDLTDRFIQGNSTPGTKKDAGLPNITGNVGQAYNQASINGGWHNYQNKGYGSGALKLSGTNNGSSCTWSGYSDAGKIDFNASSSNGIYGKSSTVQPPALTMRYIIKYI